MTPSLSFSFPSVADIEAIAGLSDPVLRNLRITYSYYLLNRAMGAVAGSRELSWCGFATWASKTAGEYIREGEVPALVEDLINRATDAAGPHATLMAHALGIHGDETPQGAQSDGFSLAAFAREIIQGVATAIGQGNQVVFRDIAPPFATLLTLWSTYRGAIPAEAKQEFLNSLRAGQLPVDYLYEAFSAMFDAAQAPGSRACAQSMCYANALVGCVEQTRVQPYVAASMNAPVADLFLQRVQIHLRSRFAAAIADGMKEALTPLAHALEVEFRRACTEWMMRLNLPEQSLRLGENVPPLPDGRMYPETLDEVDAPQPLTTLTELDALNAAACAAQDWTSYPQRMRYIGVLFRSRQQHECLWNAPFSDAQIEQINQGQIPPGPL